VVLGKTDETGNVVIVGWDPDFTKEPHQFLPSPDKFFACSLCQKVFHNETTLKLHHELSPSCAVEIINVTDAERGEVLVKDDLKVNGQKEVVNVPCPVCQKVFRSSIALEDHCDAVHGPVDDDDDDDDEEACPVCFKIFKNSDAMENHFKIHEDAKVKMYPCKWCSMEFTSRNAMKCHKCDAVEGFKCDECPNVYKGRSGLYVHKRTVHSNRRDYGCHYCTKSFAMRAQLEVHENVHTGLKPYKCDVCSKAFKAPSGLHIHKQTQHSNERPFECFICKKRLKQSYNLRVHLRTHTGVKPFNCPICNRAFAQASDCKKHLRVHNKQKSTL